ncbi:ATP-binding protein [Maricaulis alexandrii]|uniref:hypothetical protein n=1 Tax=Maricaulis alexandrii TaxID=2570354 RepID=UPI0011086D63|nr:hypothetical protein [Maricaulis alexandrii]
MSDSEENPVPEAAPQGENFKPSDFMRTRRPGAYSDSSKDAPPIIERAVFEYVLDSLTSRGEEKEFEHFARRLAECEICPNLLPQTGPTGGGDSKVDSETYPVAEEIADRWYVGETGSNSERWAFAFSAKKDWKPKFKSDVQKIIGTSRGYARIFFVTNQFVPDKKRAQIEDDLGREHSLPIRLLDKSWIVEKVFENDHLELAAKALHISTSAAAEKRLGPNDAERRALLDQLELQLGDPDRYRGVEYQLADDALEAAMFSRELERPKAKTEGRFDRAQRLATKYGTPRQKLRALYERLWTSCYWHDDFEPMASQFDALLSLADDAGHPQDYELVSNVITSLVSGQRYGLLSPADADVDRRYQSLLERLVPISTDNTRKNSALYAKSLMAGLKLVLCMGDAEQTDEALGEWKEIFNLAPRMGEFPFEKNVEVFQQLGDALGHLPAYSSAFEVMLAGLETRRTEAEGGKVLLKRGLQQVRADSPYEAIRTLGRAMQRLIKFEHRGELTLALLGVASAYQAVGLSWAAHSTLLAAASTSLRVLTVDEHYTEAPLSAVLELVWTCCRLGRPIDAVKYLILADRITALLAQRGMTESQIKEYRENRRIVDGVIGMLIMKLSSDQIVEAAPLVDVLEGMDLIGAAMSLIYVLGEDLVADGYFPPETDQDSVDEFFEMLEAQPAREDIPSTVELGAGGEAKFQSPVMGVSWTVTADSDRHSSQVAQALLGSIEAFFATSTGGDAVPHISQVEMRVRRAEASDDRPPLGFVIGDGAPLMDIVLNANFDPVDHAQDGVIETFLRDVIGTLIPRIMFIEDAEKYLARIAGDEEGFGRSLAFSNIVTPISNLIDHEDEDILQNSPNLRFAPTKRRITECRDRRAARRPKSATHEPKPIEFGEGEPPADMPDFENLKHTNRKVVSIIDVDAWDNAGWSGIGIIYSPGQPPFFALLFRNRAAAERIFTGWRSNVGRCDENGLIRVVAVTGIDVAHPSHYKVVIGVDLDHAAAQVRQSDQVLFTSRIHKMLPETSTNLDAFRTQLAKFGCYWLVPAIVSEQSSEPDILFDLAILKQKVVFRHAWEIGDNDPDLVAISLDDDPIIPDDEVDPPVLKALKRKRSWKN